MKRYVRGLCCGLWLGCAPLWAEDNPQPRPNVVLATGVSYQFGGKVVPINPTTEFDCGDQIYALVDIAPQDEGEHELEWLWRGPAQTILDRSSHQWRSLGKQFQAQNQTVARWIHFRRGKGNAMASLFDPSFGYAVFIGDWQLELQLNQQRLSQTQFSVQC